MGATSLIMIAWPNWMRERPFSSTVSNRSVISNGVPLALPAGSNAANSSRSGAFVTNAISIYTPLSCVGKLLQMGRYHCTIAFFWVVAASAPGPPQPPPIASYEPRSARSHEESEQGILKSYYYADVHDILQITLCPKYLLPSYRKSSCF